MYVPEFPILSECWIVLYGMHILHLSRCVQPVGHGQYASKASCEYSIRLFWCVWVGVCLYAHVCYLIVQASSMNFVGDNIVFQCHRLAHMIPLSVGGHKLLLLLTLLNDIVAIKKAQLPGWDPVLTLLAISRSHGNFSFSIFIYFCPSEGRRVCAVAHIWRSEDSSQYSPATL